MNIIYILYTLLGIVLGYTICYLRVKRKEKEIPKRKGLVNKSYTITDTITNSEKYSIDVEFEVIEIESTDKKTKVKVLSSFASYSEYNSGPTKDKIIKMVDGSWVDSKDISWIEKSFSQKRDDKLNEILNN